MLKRSNHSIHLNWIRYPNQQLSVEHDAGDGTSISAAALAAGHAWRISRGAAPRLEQKQGERGRATRFTLSSRSPGLVVFSWGEANRVRPRRESREECERGSRERGGGGVCVGGE